MIQEVLISVKPTGTKKTRASTAFSAWINNNKEMPSKYAEGCSEVCSVTDVDFMIHAYKLGTFILIEEKTHGAKPSWSQRDNYKVLTQGFSVNSGFRGSFCVSFDRTSPEDGGWTIFILNDRCTRKTGCDEVMRHNFKNAEASSAALNEFILGRLRNNQSDDLGCDLDRGLVKSLEISNYKLLQENERLTKMFNNLSDSLKLLTTEFGVIK